MDIIHPIYKTNNLKHDPELALKGINLTPQYTLATNNKVIKKWTNYDSKAKKISRV